MSSDRLVQAFIADVDDMNTFDNIEQMKSEISGIKGIQMNHIVRLYRFNGSDSSRIHYRIISKTNDGTGVPVRINTSRDPVAPKVIDAFANICIGFPYWEDGNLVYWDGSNKHIVGTKAAQKSIADTSELYKALEVKSGFYPKKLSFNNQTQVHHFQYVSEFNVDVGLLPEALTVSDPDALKITLDESYDTDVAFKVELLKPITTPITIKYGEATLEVKMNG